MPRNRNTAGRYIAYERGTFERELISAEYAIARKSKPEPVRPPVRPSFDLISECHRLLTEQAQPAS